MLNAGSYADQSRLKEVERSIAQHAASRYIR